MATRRVWRTETWFPWKHVLLVLDPGSARLVVPGRVSTALSAVAAQLGVWWYLLFLWGILPAVRPAYDSVGFDLFIGAGIGGSAALFAAGYWLQRWCLTIRPSQSLPLRFLSAGPEALYTYADVDLGGWGTRIRIMAPWPRFSRALHRLVMEPVRRSLTS